MCGIGLTLFPSIDLNCSNQSAESVERCLVERISSRGPDYQGVATTSLNLRDQELDKVSNEDTAVRVSDYVSRVALKSSTSWDLKLYASVLHMRGKELAPQPYQLHGVNNDNQKNMHNNYNFCWNGECYSHEEMLGRPFYDWADADADVDADGNENVSDTALVLALVRDALEESSSGDGSWKGDERVENDTARNKKNRRHEEEHEKIAQVFSRIHGEYSFILQCRLGVNISEKDENDDKGCVYFGRDPFGRRSLLMSSLSISASLSEIEESIARTALDSFILSSVGLDLDPGPNMETIETEREINRLDLEEIPAGIVYCLDLNTGVISSVPLPKRVSNQFQHEIPKHDIVRPVKFEKEPNVPTHLIRSAERLHYNLSKAVRRRVIRAPIPACDSDGNGKGNGNSDKHDNQASVAVLFSGGVDSVVLAALCHDHVPLDQPIDLINVAFANSKSNSNANAIQGQDPYSLSPDRQAAFLSYREMQKLWPGRQWRFISVNVDYTEVLEMERLICGLIAPLTSTMDFNIGTAFWFASRGIGVCVDVDVNADELESPSDTASHGISSTSSHLRFGAGQDQQSKPIECEFECTSFGCKRKPASDCIFGACKICCLSYQRRINQFMGGRGDVCEPHSKQGGKQKNKNKNNKKKKKVGGSVSSSTKQQNNETKYRCNRNSQIQDKSLHVVETETKINHADTGTGTEKITTTRTYASKARVILVGIGADEQMAGYGRHRVTYNRGGYSALRMELQMEQQRLWTRNLGRDDRCISFHGKEARFPFLDDDVVGYLSSLDVTELCDMSQGQGVGDKMILRLVAKNIGVKACSGLVKRAIQFGSRIAKCSDVDRFGSSSKASGNAKHASSLN